MQERSGHNIRAMPHIRSVYEMLVSISEVILSYLQPHNHQSNSVSKGSENGKALVLTDTPSRRASIPPASHLHVLIALVKRSAFASICTKPSVT